MTYSFLNNEFLSADKTALHVSDLSIQRGYAIFDYFKMVNGRIPFLDDYLNRFYQSAELMHLSVSLSRDELKSVVRELLHRNGTHTAGIKLLLTGGYSADAYTLGTPNLLISQHIFEEIQDAVIDKGVKIITHEFRREMPLVKSINYCTGIWLQPKINAVGAADVLYHLNGDLSEFPRCNLFVVKKNGEVITPAEHTLQGITRKNILSINTEGIHPITGRVTLTDLYEAREVFLTSTTKRIVPIIQADDTVIGTGKPGPVTMLLLKHLLEKEQLSAG